MAVKTRLPLGMEDFKQIRTEKFYYVDKTGLIRDLLENIAHVQLFTRPRRFGKTLNMSMFKYFFEMGSDRTLFDGLAISKEEELCDKYMGKFPVISVSLKDAAGRNFNDAKKRMRSIIAREASRFSFLVQSDSLTEMERRQYEALIHVDQTGIYTMPDEMIQESIFLLSQLLFKYYGQKVIILIDEYDVPLDKAYQSDYYDEMVDFIRAMFSRALKTNDSLYFAVLTGCLRISKESIFTGLNNFNVYTVKNVRYNEYFGFTDEEVRQILAFYGFMDQYDAIKKWYNGYQFGNLGVYCPWDVINYCGDLRGGDVTRPQNYWVNTSSNDLVRKFIGRAKSITRNEIELLIDGGSVRKEIHQELTYRDLDSKIDNLWSLLFTTGYLTQRGEEENGMTELVIPNNEIRWIFVKQIREWFDEESAKDIHKLESFCRAFQENDTAAIEEGFTSYLRKTISIRDNSVRKDMKENFYHGILLGLFAHMDNWSVSSNAESGEGYSDISIEVEDKDIGIVIELKYAENAAFEDACSEAMRQIKDKNYEEALIDDGMKTIYRYGIACYKKRCKVLSCVSG
ncbi:MAG: ATP-binding protein [Lachnospiraceae bacterium]|nr:ATP-binding protein [Lachnospiraceae bacterium]